MAIKDSENAIVPSHYNIPGQPTCIEIIEMLADQHANDVFTDYNRYQAFKYLWRAGKKDPVLQDLKKARQFLNFAIERLERLSAEKLK